MFWVPTGGQAFRLRLVDETVGFAAIGDESEKGLWESRLAGESACPTAQNRQFYGFLWDCRAFFSSLAGPWEGAGFLPAIANSIRALWR